MESNQGGNKKIYVAIIVLLLLINGVALYLLYSENKAKTDLGTQKTALEADFKNLTDTLDAKKMELEQYRGTNAELDSAITAQQQEIEKQKQAINQMVAKGKANNAELAKARKLIGEYETSIAELKTKVDELTKQNKQLTDQNQQLSTDLSSEKQTTQQLNEQKAVLAKKVEQGSLLQLRGLEVTGIKKKSSGKETEVKRVKQVESLRISFETGENKVLESGNLSLYVRIINPRGETISVADQGSGTLKLAESNDNVQYSKKADFDYNKTNKKVVIYWSQNIKDAGTYKVEVYQSGYLVGKGEVELK